MKAHDPATRSAARANLPGWARVVLALGGLTLCTFAFLVFGGGGSPDCQAIVRALAGFGIGVYFLVGAAIGRWPGMHVGSFFP